MTGVDIDVDAINVFNEKARKDNLEDKVETIDSDIYEFVNRNRDRVFDNIFSSVSIRFLPVEKALETYSWMQTNTAPGGLNIIKDFTEEGSWDTGDNEKAFWLKRGELIQKYKNWELITYHEEPSMTRSGAVQNLASIIVRKPSI